MTGIDWSDVRVASPCGVRWDAMTGDDRVRHCGACKLDVYDFSRLTRAEIENLLRLREGRVCARLYRRRDGTLLTKDCPVGRWRKTRMRLLAVAAAAAGIVAAVFAARSSTPAAARCESGWARRVERFPVVGRLVASLAGIPRDEPRVVTGMIALPDGGGR